MDVCATEPLRQVVLAEEEGSTLAGAPFNLQLQSGTVGNIEVKTTYFTWDGEVVSQPEPVAIIIVRTISTGVLAGSESIVADAGDTITIENPHQVNLGPGIYEERIVIRVIDSLLNDAVDDVCVRLVEITDAGGRPLESSEYSELVEPKTTVVDPYGNRIVAIVGVAGPVLQPDQLRDPHPAVMIESGDPDIRIPEPTLPIEAGENDDTGGSQP